MHARHVLQRVKGIPLFNSYTKCALVKLYISSWHSKSRRDTLYKDQSIPYMISTLSGPTVVGPM